MPTENPTNINPTTGTNAGVMATPLQVSLPGGVSVATPTSSQNSNQTFSQISPSQVQTQTTSLGGQFNDPQALAITRAIATQENGGQQPSPSNYYAKGKSGEYGMYQFTKSTWNNYANQILGNPEADPTPANQNAVAYGMAKRWLSEGWTPKMIFSAWNAGAGNYDALNTGYITTSSGQQPLSGINEKGVPYNVNNYVNGAMNSYQNESQKLGINPLTGTGSSATGGHTSQDITQNIQSGNITGALGNVINWAFPIINDIGTDLGATGGPKKTFLQQLGDAGLSALWFIPGLGEVGEGARAGLEGAGLLTKALASPLLRGAAIGYGGGVAANLSQGQGLGQALTPQASNLLGALGGVALPTALKALGSARLSLSGISPQIQTILKESGVNPEDVVNVLKQAQAHAQDVRQPTPLTMAADTLDEAAREISNKTAAAGREVETAKNALNNIKLPTAIGKSPNTQNILSDIENIFGITIDKSGKAIPLRQTPPITSSNAKDVAQIFKSIKRLTTKSTARDLADVIDNINNKIELLKSGLTKPEGASPMLAFYSKIRSQLNQELRNISPEIANANDKFSAIKSINREVRKMAGPQGQRGTLLLKRVFSGDKQGQVQNLFSEIKSLTGKDLTQKAALASLAIQVSGDRSEQGLLQQAIEGGLREGGTLNPTSLLYKWGAGVARKYLANPQKMAVALSRETPTRTGALLTALGRRSAGIGGRLGASTGQIISPVISPQ